MLELNDRSFDRFIAEGRSVVVAGAAWCKRCKYGERQLEELQSEFPDIKTGKIDLQMNPMILMRYAPNGIPHFILFEDGLVVYRGTDIGPVREKLERNRK